MSKINNYNSLNRNFIISVIIIFLFGTLSHFIYNFSNESAIIGSFFPVNESVWEHLKLLLIPIISWWIVFYIVNKDKLRIDIDKWFLGAVVALISAMLFQITVYYFYTQAFNIESLIIDILLFLLSIIVGQFTGLHIYKYSKGIDYKISILILIIIILIFIYFTFNAPHFPVFKDSNTRNYGI